MPGAGKLRQRFNQIWQKMNWKKWKCCRERVWNQFFSDSKIYSSYIRKKNLIQSKKSIEKIKHVNDLENIYFA